MTPYMGDWQVYKALFDLNSGTIVIFDAYNEQVLVVSHGSRRESIDENHIKSITDNITPLAEKGDYYACASEALNEIADLLYGKRTRHELLYDADITCTLRDSKNTVIDRRLHIPWSSD